MNGLYLEGACPGLLDLEVVVFVLLLWNTKELQVTEGAGAPSQTLHLNEFSLHRLP